MSDKQHTKTAILSVYDKTGLLDLAKGLVAANVRILASGGTAKLIREAGFPVEDVSSITHAPEMLGGRVKTYIQLFMVVFWLKLRKRREHDLTAQGIEKVDFVVCNLYPFKETISKVAVTVPEAVEEIDIGGVTLLRAAAKNHEKSFHLIRPTRLCPFLGRIEEWGNHCRN